MRKPLITAVAALAAGATILSGCGSSGTAQKSDQSKGASSSTSTPGRGGTVHMLQNADFSYIDPARGFDGGVNSFYRLLYRGLTMQAAGNAKDPNAIVPDMATSLGKSSDGAKTWTYTLKTGLKFDNGKPITSKEMKFGIERAWDPDIGIGSPYLKTVIAAPANYQGPYKSGDLSTIETPDAQTIVFHLKQAFPEFDAVLAQPNAVPFPVGSGKGNAFIKTTIASGPYTIDKYTPGSVIKLKRNPNWSQSTDSVRKAYPNAWEFDIGLDGATIDERMLAGQGSDINAIAQTVQPSTVARLNTPQVRDRVVTAPAYCTTYMGLNTTKTPLNKVQVRQAVSYAVDKASVRNASGGTQLADITNTILPTTVTGHKDFDLYPSKDNAGDIPKAKALLKEAGLPNGFTMTMDIRSQPMMQAQAEAIQNSLKKAGITVKLNVIDTSTYYETIGTISQQHDAAITGWCPDWASSARTFIPPLFDGRNITPKGNSNLAQFNDPAVNKRIDEISAMTDLNAASEQWGQLDKQILQQAPIVPLVLQKGLMIPGSNIAGYYPSTNLTDLTNVGLKDPSKG